MITKTARRSHFKCKSRGSDRSFIQVYLCCLNVLLALPLLMSSFSPLVIFRVPLYLHCWMMKWQLWWTLGLATSRPFLLMKRVDKIEKENLKSTATWSWRMMEASYKFLLFQICHFFHHACITVNDDLVVCYTFTLLSVQSWNFRQHQL